MDIGMLIVTFYMTKCYPLKLVSCSVITIANSRQLFSMTSQGRASTVNEVGQIDLKVAKQLLVSYSRPHKSRAWD